MKLGLIGFGYLGRTVAEAVQDGRAGIHEISAILVRDRSKRVGETFASCVTDDIDDFLLLRPELVIEVAGQEALRSHAVHVLSAKSHLMALSIGAFADDAFFQEVVATAEKHHRKLIIPSGGIAGIDMISAASLVAIQSITHTTRKPLRVAFSEAQLAGHTFHSDAAALLYDGPAREGVGLFPENVNVAAAVSLAGIGFDRTQLRIFADPNLDQNRHEIEMVSQAGKVKIVVENTPSAENPKTSEIVHLSILQGLRNLTSSFVIGI